MAEHLKKWLQQNKKENDEALKNIKSANQVLTQVSSAQNNVPHEADRVSGGQGLNDAASAQSTSQQSKTDPIPSTSRISDPIPSTSGVQAKTSRTSLLQQNTASNANVSKPSELVFENNSLKMTVSQAAHLQEKRFKA